MNFSGCVWCRQNNLAGRSGNSRHAGFDPAIDMVQKAAVSALDFDVVTEIFPVKDILKPGVSTILMVKLNPTSNASTH
jgi:hypothetical protein